VRRSFWLATHDHPDCDDLTIFVCSFVIEDQSYRLNDLATGELHRITETHLQGEFQFRSRGSRADDGTTGWSPLRRRGRHLLRVGRPTVWVHTTDERPKREDSWRTKDEGRSGNLPRPLRLRPGGFRGLLGITPPERFAPSADRSCAGAQNDAALDE
jgi:hypothetical protein